jgi:adenine-specific DNA-methyltransferase
MPPRHHGRLELTWTNKDQTLLAHENQSYEWVDPSDYRVSEIRLLHDVSTVGTVAATHRASDNLLIRGDALHALNSLNQIPEFAREYAGKVKLVYIDPPFNTGQTFAQYDDGLEHSVWLTMMRDRLLQLRDLLAAGGSVWVHLDDAEIGHSRVLMDEVFGGHNFVSAVIWEKADSPNNSAQFFSIDQDTILVYAKDRRAWKRNRLPRTAALDSIYTNPDGDPRGRWYPGDPFANKPYSLGRYEVTGPTGRPFQPPPGRFWRISEQKFWDFDRDGRIWWGPAGEARPSIKRFLDEVDGAVPRTLWRHADVGSNRTSKNEMRALFPGEASFATPKPEALIRRIVQIATEPGDIVLDCYGGSGTTAAVAHKMGRRWVTSEWSAQTVQTFTLPRLERVVAGDDPGGITTVDVPVGDDLPEGMLPGSPRAAAKTIGMLAKAELLGGIEGLTAEARIALIRALRAIDKTRTETVWEGGGGFRVLDVGPSMFESIDGRVYLAEWATDNALAEALAAQLSYDYIVDAPFCGTKGRTRLAVVDGLVNEGVIRLLIEALPEGQRLMVCGTAIDPDARAVLKLLRPGSTMKKIPGALLDDYRMQRRDLLALTSVLDWSQAAGEIQADDATAGAGTP